VVAPGLGTQHHQVFIRMEGKIMDGECDVRVISIRGGNRNLTVDSSWTDPVYDARPQAKRRRLRGDDGDGDDTTAWGTCAASIK
jgi:hypothetical protein